MRVSVDVIKVAIIFGFIFGGICLVRTAYSEEKTYLQTSNLDPRKTFVYESNPNGQDKATGYLRQSYLDPRKTVVYDADGKEQGYFRKNYLDSRKTIYVSKKD